MPKKITMQEAAETYGVTYRTIRRYVADGRLTAYRVGPRLIRLDPEQVASQFLAQSAG